MTVAAVLGVRSPHCKKRANSILDLMKWAAVNEELRMPWSKHVVWCFCLHVKESQGAATKGDSLLSALRFTRFIFGFHIDGTISSRRLKGLTQQMPSNKRPLKQAAVLTVRQVAELHRLMDDPSLRIFDRFFCAHILLALYGRCRHSDLAFVKEVLCDYDEKGGFIEIRTTVRQTSRSAMNKTALLPILIPGIGVDGKPCLRKARHLFAQVGLSLDGHIGGPLLKAPKSHDCFEWNKRGPTSQELGKMLSALL